ncbi:uncharacterized protein BT62DRAFT_1007723 [Guyanagaster necrorhizus]|uniref:Uncharacterized protein n=1 Tax=Guyanagaster necrorhizus TaxID=856835 RepID=A0A9P8AR13_9AGAR|nr:uncharacterized protein BT62DRAFT_1007723 [Guyanagaster necrorhizus MCA 3950]KAG7444694.1 hypothetical protein BT62DRAFT_1007723 [Guyanagaster necrorhizus MCA 3950]
MSPRSTPSTLASAMQSTRERLAGYSDFFASGLLAKARRAYERQRQPASAIFPEFSITPSPQPKDLRRHSSVYKRMSVSGSLDTDSDFSVQEKRRRRSSVAEFSSRLFDRITTNPSTGERRSADLAAKIPRRKSLRKQSVVPDDSDVVWITAPEPRPVEPTRTHSSSCNSDEISFHSLDPFTAAPNARSIYIEISPPPPKLESFLSFSGSSMSGSVHSLAFPRRERPTSIQTMPPPSTQSPRSSFYSNRRSTIVEFPRVLEEEESWIGDDDEPLDEDDPARIDWRQFHVEVLQDG